MNAFKYILLFTLQFLLCAICVAQREQIDSLKKVLPSLIDTARVDCLNALSEAYIKVEIDTSEIFNLQSLKEAENINYIHGIAEATSLKATIVFDKYDNYSEVVNLARKAILLYAKTGNKNRLNRTYYELGHALYAQSYFEEAINNFNISYDLSKQEGDSAYIFYSVTNSAYAYFDGGDYKNAFEKGLEMHQLALKNNNAKWKFWESAFISGLYESIGDFHTALIYARQCIQLTKPDNADFIGMAELYSRNQQFDSARYYFSFVDTSNDERALRMFLISTGEYYFLQGKYDKALPNFLRGLSYHKRINDRNQVMRTLVDIAKTYSSLHNYTSAFQFAQDALALARQTGARQFIGDCYRILYSVYKHWNQIDSALFFHEQYTAIKDSIISDQVAAKLVAYDFNLRIELLNKEKEIQQASLQKETLWRKYLITVIITLALLAIIIVRVIMLKRKNEAHKRELAENELQIQKLESEKKEDALNQQATELEMQALRAQMNPHFIFNSLNSINRFILKKQSSEATEYLTKFSRLIRMILNSSASTSVSLAEDLEALELYLELESLRFDNKFSYKIECNPDVDADFIRVPPMLLQPFVENAIWHGLMNKEGEGHLCINIDQDKSTLICTITDDGIGRKKAAALKNVSGKHKSMGMKITESRIAMLQKMSEGKPVEIRDLVDVHGNAAGTEVFIKIPVVYD